jgi:predicted Zn-dependent protease
LKSIIYGTADALSHYSNMAGIGYDFRPKLVHSQGRSLYRLPRFRSRRDRITVTLVLLTGAACSSSKGLPDPTSSQYADLVRAFYVGVAGLQTGADDPARQNLTRATQIAPGEPAGWADLGILALRQQDFDAAFKNADQARSLLPDNSRIEQLLGTIESKRGKPQESIAHLKKAVAADSGNVKALYALAEETDRQGEANSSADAQ